MNFKVKKDDSPFVTITSTSNKNDITLFTFDEEVGEQSYQDFVEKNIEKVLGFKLCFISKLKNRNNGIPDFLAIDKNGSLFILEAKLFKNIEIRYKVMFQCLKYIINMAELKDEFSDTSNNQANNELNNNVINRIKEKFDLNKEGLSKISKNIFKNIENMQVNPIIVVDKAPKELICGTLLMSIGPTNIFINVLEMTELTIGKDKYIYARKYFKGDEINDFISYKKPNERGPHITKEERIEKAETATIKSGIKTIVSLLEKDGYKFRWGTKNSSGFTILTPKTEKSLGIDIYDCGEIVFWHVSCLAQLKNEINSKYSSNEPSDDHIWCTLDKEHTIQSWEDEDEINSIKNVVNIPPEEVVRIAKKIHSLIGLDQ